MDRSTSPYLHTSLHHPASRAANLSTSAVNDVFDSHSSNSPSGIPSATSLSSIVDAIKGNILSIVHARDEACDQMMRELASRKKERIERDRIRDLEIAKRDAEERRQQMKKATTPQKKEKEKERPLAVGAHGVARQDGVDRNGKLPLYHIPFICCILHHERCALQTWEAPHGLPHMPYVQ
jgi:transcriptional adapter 3